MMKMMKNDEKDDENLQKTMKSMKFDEKGWNMVKNHERDEK